MKSTLQPTGKILLGVFCIILSLASCTSTPKEASVETPQEKVTETKGEEDVWALLEQGESEKTRALFRGKVDINTRDSQGRTPLHRAVELGDSDLAAFFISLGAAVDAQDSAGRTALEIACEKQDIPCTKALIEGKGNIFLASSPETTPAAVALRSGDPLLAALLSPTSVGLKNNAGQTILHVASDAGNYQAASAILAVDGTVNLKDTKGKTALDLAYDKPQSLNHALTAEQLIRSGGQAQAEGFDYLAPAVLSSNYNIRYADGLAPLHFAARSGQKGFVELILKRNINVNAKDSSGNTALHEAARAGKVDIMELLLASGADPNARDGKGNSALHIVMPPEVRKAGMTLLLAHKANPNGKDEYGDTPLHIAINLNMGTDIASLLITSGADLSIRNIEGRTALHAVIEMDRSAYVPLLLNKNADIFAADTKGITSLDMALAKNALCLPALITEKTVQTSDNGGNTPLHTAVAASASMETVALILDRGGSINALNRAGDTALHLAVRKDNRELGELLISRGADIFAVNAQGHSPLYLATHSEGKLREWMLNSTTLKAQDSLGNYIIHYAAQWKLDDIIDDIVQRGSSTELKNGTGETALFSAVKADSPITITALTKAGSNLHARDTLGNTALHKAVRWNSLAGVQALLEEGIDKDVRNLSGKTALHEAVRLGMSNIEELLLSSGVSLELRDTEGNTPLMEAASAGLAGTMERLMEWGADPTTRNNRGDTPLHLAAALGQQDVAGLLLNRGASIHAKNSSGRTPLQLALHRSPEITAALLTKDRLLMSDDNGRSPLHIAILDKAELSVIETILGLGARVNIADAEGKTPLRLAVEVEAWDLARRLTEAGSDLFIKGSDGESPGTLALLKGEAALKALFNTNNINSGDTVGNTILHYAAYRGTARTLGLLLELGADRSSRNFSGERPADLARRWNKMDLAMLLE